MTAVNEANDRTCQDCGMLLDDAGQFHPAAFCALKLAGFDPWATLLWINHELGVDVTHWPSKPPRVRDLKTVGEVPAR